MDTDALALEGKRLLKVKDGVTPDNVRAFSLFSEAALDGHAEAQCLVSECYRHGRGVQKDEARADSWLQKSAESGWPKANLFLAHRYQWSVPPNEEKAILCYEKAAEAGSDIASALLASLYKDKGDAAGELRWNKEASLQGERDAIWHVRDYYADSDLAAVDLPEACAWLLLFEDSFTTRLENEELSASRLALLQRDNVNIDQFYTASLKVKAHLSASQLEEATERYQDLVKQRLKWLRKKAEAGDRGAQYYLAWCYRDGYGFRQDQQEGVRWMQRAAEQGMKRAQNALGYWFKEGDGVEQDHAEANKWFRMAAEQGYRTAQYNLGHSLCMGLGATQDYVEGAKWIRKAAEAGNSTAQYGMGFLCEHGYGVPKDEAAAMSWYRKAAERGDTEAQKKCK